VKKGRPHAVPHRLRREGALGAPATWHEAPLRAYAVDDTVEEALAVRAGDWLLAFNPDAHARPWPPEALEGAEWTVALDTRPDTPATEVTAPLAPRSLRLLRRRSSR